MAAHVYLVTKSMEDQYFYNADGEMLVVRAAGRLRFFTEFGRIEVEPGEICIIPRGVKFKVEIPSTAPHAAMSARTMAARSPCPTAARSVPIALPTRATSSRRSPAFEDKDTPTELYVKWCGGFYVAEIGHSPLDVVAWHGNYAPYKYDLRHFSPVGAICSITPIRRSSPC